MTDLAWRFRQRARSLRERAGAADMPEVRDALLWQADRCEREADTLDAPSEAAQT